MCVFGVCYPVHYRAESEAPWLHIPALLLLEREALDNLFSLLYHLSFLCLENEVTELISKVTSNFEIK